MIRINLLPPGARGAAARSQLVALPWRRIGLGAAGALVVYSVGLLGWNQVQAGALRAVTAEWEALQPEWAAFQKTQGALQALRDRVAVIQTLQRPEARWAPRLNLLTDALVADLWFTTLTCRTTSGGEARAFLADEFKGMPGLEWPQEMLPEAEAPSATPGGPNTPSGASAPAPRPLMVLKGSAIAPAGDKGAPVTRYLQQLKEQPEFSRWFLDLELKDIASAKVQQEEVSGFVIALYPTGT